MKATKASLIFLIGIFCGALILAATSSWENGRITKNMIQQAEKIIGLEFNEAKRDSMMEGLEAQLNDYEAIRELDIDNGVHPSLLFNPVPPGKIFETEQKDINWNLPKEVNRPDSDMELAFMSVAELSVLIRSGQLTSTELTRLYLERLKKYDERLEAVITLTEERALQQAEQADKEIGEGKYRGPLHGIPYGIKDLFALKGYKTTWGAVPYKDQVRDETATVIHKLDDAGAVLVAKLTLGALAWGDVWFDGVTKNPWNTEQGASGSSAGSGAATSAGLVGFAIGTETLGSIVSPSTRTGVTGLRPTFGRISRTGAMALSWSMDKVGPMTRTVTDAALVFDALHGPDGMDQTLVDLPFNYKENIDLSQLRIGYVKSAFESDYANKENDKETIKQLEALGAEFIPFELPDMPFSALSFILSAEAAAAFDELTRSEQDDTMVRQVKNAWPNVFRTARFIPAVEYIQANRVRSMLIREMDAQMEDVDVYISPSFAGGNLLMTNLTGHPAVVLPNGFDENGNPTSITFMGDLYDEATVLAVANKYQQAAGYHFKYPPGFE